MTHILRLISMATGIQNRSITKITKVYISLLIFMIETQNWCQNVQNNILQVFVYSLCKLTDQHIH